MAYQVLLTEEAIKDVEDLEQIILKLLNKKLAHYAALDDIGVVAKKLINHDPGVFRLCAGNYRLLCKINGRTLRVLRIVDRKVAYR